MVAPASLAVDQIGLRQVARRPRDSDGVGEALRQVFGKPCGLPNDLGKLLSRLNQTD